MFCVTKGVGALYVIMDVIRRKMRERKEEEERITHFKSIQESVTDEFVVYFTVKCWWYEPCFDLGIFENNKFMLNFGQGPAGF